MPSNRLQLYQHDEPHAFRFVLRGGLEADAVEDLEHAWTTARSTMTGQDFVVDLSAVTVADEKGLTLLGRMRDSGARLTAGAPPESPGIALMLGVPAANEARREREFRLRLRSILERWRAWQINRRSCRSYPGSR